MAASRCLPSLLSVVHPTLACLRRTSQLPAAALVITPQSLTGASGVRLSSTGLHQEWNYIFFPKIHCSPGWGNDWVSLLSRICESTECCSPWWCPVGWLPVWQLVGLPEVGDGGGYGRKYWWWTKSLTPLIKDLTYCLSVRKRQTHPRRKLHLLSVAFITLYKNAKVCGYP